MKKLLYLSLAVFLLLPSICAAEDFYQAPLFPGAKVVDKTKTRLEMKTQASHDEILAYYKEALKKQEDIKFRDWNDSTYIEDDGALPWHSINISKEAPGQETTTIVIMKDNWSWIIGTLILRFIGVFAVLLIVFMGMTVSGAIISRVVNRSQSKKELAKAS